MEMLDVLRRLQEIAETKPDLVADAVANVKATNPQAVVQNAVQSEPAMKTDEGGMSDVHIGAQEVVGEFSNEDGDLKMPKDQVLKAMDMEKAKAPFPKSYEIEMAMQMVQDEFDDQGERKPDMDMNSEQPTDEGNAFAQAVQQAKASGMKKGDKFKVGDEEHTLRDSDFEDINTNTMKTEEGKIPAGLKAYQDKKAGKEEKKETVKEAVQISTDSPEEAGMMMQILKLAGVQPVDQKMISQEPEAGEENPEHGEPGHVCGDETDGDEMAKYRSMVTAPDEEKAEETFANEPEEKVQDIDTLVNVHSGGLNRQKQQVRKEYPGDNPLAVKEDTVTEQDLANSLRNQYESFKSDYQEAVKVAEAKAKPDFLDMDKDGDKKEPMKKAVADKENK
jgi:hypothetical protein